jgi:hypothetical protein
VHRICFNLLFPACILQVPHVDRTEYQLIDISEDGYVCLLPTPSLSFIQLSFWQCLPVYNKWGGHFTG